MANMTELLNARLHASDSTCPVREVFFDPKTREIKFIALDLGGWFDVDDVLVSAHLLQRTEDGAGWQVALSQSDLEAAPRWQDSESDVNLSAWPPIIVGPFGGTYAPILLYEQMLASGGAHDEDETPPEDSIVGTLERAHAWLNLPVFDEEGEIGALFDLRFDPENFHISNIVVAPDRLVSSNRIEFPILSVHIAKQHSHLILAGSRRDGKQV